MISAVELASYLDDILETRTMPDYPGAVNGLQLANRGALSKIAASVDFSTQSVSASIAEGANLLLVHHGMFWGGTRPFTGVSYARLRRLIEHDLAVYSSHLPLDRHPRFGNNVLLSEELGLEPSGEFASYRGTSIGVSGESTILTTELADRARRFARAHGGDVVTTPITQGRKSMRWAICTGSGASAETLSEAVALGIDTLIVGEGPHWTAVEAADLGITVIYAGHYATETLGVSALAAHLADRFGLDWTMIHVPTGL